MRVRTRSIAAVALASSVALLAAACGGQSGTGSTTAQGQEGGEISVRGCTPENPLIPTNTNEVCGGNVLDAVTAKLVHYNSDTAKPENDIAESIETTDNQNFTIKLKTGYKFSDGTEVKAHNFVDAWNWGAYGPNGQLNSYFFEPIEGFADTQCTDEACKTAKSETMSGLKVVDDYTFTIKTTSPVSNLPVRLGYTAFAPQSDAFLNASDKTELGKLPIGAGPFKVTSNTATEIVIEKFADYSGSNKPHVDKVTFKIYNDTSAAFNDVVANNLDLTDVIPADQLVGDAWKSQLPDRNGSRETGIIQVMTFSSKDTQLKNVDLRRALSMAIDRDLITKQIFNGARTPATGWVSPVVDGYKAGACGDNCTFNKDEAKKLYDAAGGYDGTLLLSVNGDGGHKLWADAVCNQWKANLGVDCKVNITPDFKTLRQQINNRELTGLFRSGWQMDYPSIENFLTPIYATGASSNDGDYSNANFDAKLKEAAAATSSDEANTLYQEAEQILGQDMPTIPQWYQNSQFGYSTKVTNVKMTPFSTWDLSAVQVK
ncbi:peptide ABC transporter substrate-binding protein [Propionicicella superfundia]|uniref:peptide ABC transporter substrate-binding protein n=1 Tax=Propionicicella superfundia TaxID=348582 RepID=UPI0003FF4A0E|nr:ABC transporter substrate-binding protein [Propionicicella superfundia]